jgi:hypothetical protein
VLRFTLESPIERAILSRSGRFSPVKEERVSELLPVPLHKGTDPRSQLNEVVPRVNLLVLEGWGDFFILTNRGEEVTAIISLLIIAKFHESK